jgi:tRNA G18 (ribose-2'-O)-methylase SpoU
MSKSSTRRRRCRENQQNATLSPALMDSPHLDMRMIRKAEGAIQKRTSRITVVVERCTNDFNYSAILRTVEALGVQTVFLIRPPAIRSYETNVLTTMKGTNVKQAHEELEGRKMHHLFAQRATEWLTVREFDTTLDCIEELTRTNYAIWATDLSQHAVALTQEDLPFNKISQSVIPPKLAIVFGTEAVGCTQEMLTAADLRVYLPLRGFADSLNLSVATALVVHQLFVLDPTIEGDMTLEEQRALRESWFPKLASKRLLTSRAKKERQRIQSTIANLEEVQQKQANGEILQNIQLNKLETLDSLRKELQDLDTNLLQQARAAVQDLVDHPPAPITDMRRPDEHRTCYVGRNTKNRHDWDDMPATTGYDTALGHSSADFFRQRLVVSETNGHV